jgi:hypothetical protein
MTELLLPHTEPMPISKIRPAYTDRFQKDLRVADYGHPKLIKLLEGITDVVDVSSSVYTKCLFVVCVHWTLGLFGLAVLIHFENEVV